MLGEFAYVFRLNLTDIELDKSLEHASGLYRDEIVSAIYKALESVFDGPFYAVIEIGLGTKSSRGRIHIHVIAHRDDGPRHIRRDTERCEKVYDWIGLYHYLAKEPEAWSLEAELDARAAIVLSPGQKLPRTRRHFLGPQRLTWVASSALH